MVIKCIDEQDMKNGVVTIFTFIFVFLSTSSTVNAQLVTQSNINLSDSIPFNPEAKRITLSNGFTYYLSRNTHQAGKIYVNLNVRAGIFQQEGDQTEVAHVVEHVVMRSSRHFPEERSLKEYLKACNVTRYNAHPDNELTTYYFEIPSDTTVLQNLCLAFQDWLSGKSYLTEETLSAEKAIVSAEIAERGTVGYFNVACRLLHPSRFSETFESAASKDFKAKVAALSYTSIRQYYSDWYRPDLSGLIVVGDMNVLSTERMMKRIFAGLKNTIPKHSYVNYPILLTGENKYITDSSTNRDDGVISMRLFFVKERLAKTTYRDYREAVIVELFNEMIQRRLSDLYKSYDGQSAVHGGFASGIYALNSIRLQSLQFSTQCRNEKSIQSSLRSLFIEAERIREHGFDERELENARSEILSLLSSEDVEGLDQEAKRYSEHFIYNEAAPAAFLIQQLRKKFLSEITLEEINQISRSWITDRNRDIVIQGPKNIQSYFPSEITALSWLQEVEKNSPSKYQISKRKEIKVNFDSVYTLPSPLPYMREDFKEIGVTQLRMNNGVNVIIKRAVSSSSHRMFLQGTRFVGASGYVDSQYFSARMAPELVLQAGLGELNTDNLVEYIQKHNIRLKGNIEDLVSTIRGSAPDEELEILLQLVYRYFLPPLKDTVGYAVKMDILRNGASRKRNLVSSELTPLVGYRLKLEPYQNLSLEELNKISYDLCLKSYETVFSTPRDFTFVLTGTHDVERTIKLVVKYLGNLPTSKEKNPPPPAVGSKKENFNVSKSVVNKNLKKGTAEVFLLYTGYRPHLAREKVKQEILAKIIESICFRRLREKEAGIYSLNTSVYTQSEGPQNWYELKIMFQCDPNIRERLMRAADDELEMLKRNGPELSDFNIAVQSYKKSSMSYNMDDSMWQVRLLDLYKDGEEFSSTTFLDELINCIQPADIQRAAQDYLQKNGFVNYAELPDVSKGGL